MLVQHLCATPKRTICALSWTAINRLCTTAVSAPKTDDNQFQRVPVFERLDEYSTCVEDVMKTASAQTNTAMPNIKAVLLQLSRGAQPKEESLEVSVNILKLLAHLRMLPNRQYLSRKVRTVLNCIEREASISSAHTSRLHNAADHIASLAVVLSHFQHHTDKEWSSLFQSAVPLLPYFSALNLGRLLTASVAAPQQPRRLLSKLPKAVRPAVLRTTLTKDISTLCQGLVAMKHYDQQVMDVVCGRTRELVGGEQVDIVRIGYCLGTFRHYDLNTLIWLSQSVVASFQSFHVQSVMKMIWVFATFNFKHTTFLDLAYQRVKRQQRSDAKFRFSSQALRQLAWSCAVFECTDKELIQSLFDAAKLFPNMAETQHPLAHSLFQLHLALKDAQQLDGLDIDESVLRAMEQASKAMMGDITVSEAQRRTFRCLQLLQMSPVLEKQTADGLFSIDIVVKYKGRNVAIEVDGPTHFSSNLPYVMTGASVLRNRFLQHRGYIALSIPLYECMMMQNLPQLKQYFERKLKAAVVG